MYPSNNNNQNNPLKKSTMKKTTLVGIRKPLLWEREKGADVVFVRMDTEGNYLNVYASTCYESWEQWGQPSEVLSDNVDDVENWRKSIE